MTLRARPIGMIATAVATVAAVLAINQGTSRVVASVDGLVAISIAWCGIVARERRPATRIGPLMIVVSAAWIAGTVWPSFLLFAHRGPLTHVYLGYPTGRLVSRPLAAVVTAVYVVAMIEPLSRVPGVTLALAATVAITSATLQLLRAEPERRSAATATVSAFGFAGVLAFSTFNQLGSWGLDRGVLWCYDLVVAVTMLMLTVELLGTPTASATVADMVQRLSTASLHGVRLEIGDALGDGSTTLAVWDESTAQYLDDRGLPVDPALVDPHRHATYLTDHGEPLAVLIHDVSALDRPEVFEAVAAAAQLAVAMHRTRIAAHDRVGELAASRQRLIHAVDDQRARFEHELSTGPRTFLRAAAELLTTARRDLPPGCCAIGEQLDELLADVDDTVAELDHLSSQAAPLALVGTELDAAIQRLASRSNVPIAASVSAHGMSPEAQAAAYYVCAEAIANAVKHAQARMVSIRIAPIDDWMVVTIVDDGLGGAAVDARDGTGLRGLVDRVEAIQGHLTIDSQPDRGTAITAHFPLRRRGGTLDVDTPRDAIL